MSKLATQLEYNDRMTEVAKDYRTENWKGVMRFLLEQAGVELCAHGYWERRAHVDCPQCSAALDGELDRDLEGGL